MFFIRELHHTIQLHPSFFGPSTLQYVETKLNSDVEGTCDPKNGFIISVLKIIHHGFGKIVQGSGLAEFKVHYRAIVFKPFKGEVLDGTVSFVGGNGFFVDVGPFKAFVSKRLIPPDYTFDPTSNPPGWHSLDDNMMIKPLTRIRLKLVGIRSDTVETQGIGTIKEDYLGIID